MRLIRRFGLTAFAALCRRHLHAMLAVGGEYPVKAGKVNSWLGHQGGQSGDEVQRLEDDVGGAVAIGGFDVQGCTNAAGAWMRRSGQLIPYLALCGQ